MGLWVYSIHFVLRSEIIQSLLIIPSKVDILFFSINKRKEKKYKLKYNYIF